MVAGRLREEAHAIVHRTALRVLRAVVEPADAGEGNGGGAERAGLQRHIEIRARQPLLAELAGGLADHRDLGMGGHVVLRPGAVARLRDDRAVLDQNRPDGHLAARAGGPRLGKRDLHEAVCHDMICHARTNSS